MLQTVPLRLSPHAVTRNLSISVVWCLHSDCLASPVFGIRYLSSSASPYSPCLAETKTLSAMTAGSFQVINRNVECCNFENRSSKTPLINNFKSFLCVHLMLYHAAFFTKIPHETKTTLQQVLAHRVTDPQPRARAGAAQPPLPPSASGNASARAACLQGSR